MSKKAGGNMNLKSCLEMGRGCGLKTLGEAWNNIELHWMQIFPYDRAFEEIQELADEIDEKKLDPKWDIDDLVDLLGWEWFFKNEESKMYGCPSLREKKDADNNM